MKLTPRLRDELKTPLGRLSKKIEDTSKYAHVVCVGDEASTSFIEAGIEPKIIVFDGHTMRKEVGISDAIKGFKGKKQTLINKAGMLNRLSFDMMSQAFQAKGSTKIQVDGEEDLLTLSAIKTAPANTLVVYGQPNKGLVYVKVDGIIKEKVNSILEEMTYGD